MTKTKQTNVQYALVFKTDEDKSEAAEIAVEFGKIVSRKFNNKENVLYVNSRQLREIKKHKELEYAFLAQNGNSNGIELRK
jgi:hypothetical protein